MKRFVWCTGAAVMAAGMVFMAPMSTRAQVRLPAGISVAGISLEGMTEKEAGETVNGYVEEKLGQTISLKVNGAETAADAAALGITWENEKAVSDAIHHAAPKGSLIRRYMKTKDLQQAPEEISLDMALDGDKLTAYIHDTCADAVPDAADASIRKEDGNFVVTPSETGVTVDADGTKENLNQAINAGRDGGLELQVAVMETQPRIRTEDLTSIRDVLGTFSTDFKTSGAARSTNLAVGTAKINGSVLMPGDVLSGYECMHPFTVENGYRTATAYENGRSVDSIGGGVCQIATTLYNAALYAELDIVQRQNHSMSVSYVKPSMDAAIAGTYKDIKIRNPYDTPIFVEGYTSGKTLTFTIYGKETRPSNRSVKFESETLKRIDAGAPIEQVDNTLLPGQRIKVDSGHTGLQSQLFKCVYVDGKLTERTLLNKDTYNASRAIYRVGPDAPVQVPAAEAGAEPTVPQETVIPETPSAEPQETAPAMPQGPGYEIPVGSNIGPGFTP